jgi:hypothetical protein
MGRAFFRLAPLAAVLSLLATRLEAQIPNTDSIMESVDSIVEKALTRSANRSGGDYIAKVMTDTGVQRAMRSDSKARRQIKSALGDYGRSFHHGNVDDGEAKQTFRQAVKDATGRDISDSPGAVATTIHVPNVDVDIPGTHIHMRGRDIQVPEVPPAPLAPPAPPAPASLTLSAAQKALIERARHDPGAASLPAVDAFTAGPRSVTGETHGSVATVNGTLQVDGIVDGDVAAVAGDVVLLPGAVVHGNATAIGGEVRQSGGTIDGEIRSTGGPIGPVARSVAAAARRSPHHQLRLSLAFLALMIVIGIGVLTFAGEPLDAAVQAVSEQFGRALGYGFVGALAALPLLVVLLVAVCITIIGILATPFVVIGYTLMVLGIALIGFFAVAETTGRAVYRRRQALDPLSERGAKLRALVTGIAIYAGLWVIAALLSELPVVGLVFHVLASAITMIVLLVGCGAVLVSRRDARGGFFRVGRKDPQAAGAPDLLWQTPTPIGGVAAARRPTPPPQSSTGAAP